MPATAPIVETQEPANPDAAAVAAVRNGDSRRYRELVERHQRRVYALAWSRLGDSVLAEEATQEAFIRGYRHLAMLGDGAKFSAWIGTIARNLAVSLGLRHRRELDRRERWALEQPRVEEPALPEEPSATETLRQALAEMPPQYRECLVLFYLEDKSGAEAAKVLGISEANLRVRLVRARAELRERLEQRLGESLGQLRPPRTLMPSIMAAVATTQMKAGGGLSTVMIATLAKILPAKFLPFAAPLAGIAPGMGMAWVTYRLELRNFKDQAGFRARLFRESSRSWLWFIAVLVGGSLGLVFGSVRLFGLLGMHVVMGVYALFFSWLAYRQTVISRSGAQICMLAYSVYLTVVMFGVGLAWIPFSFATTLIGIGFLFLLPTVRDRPTRMDYSLFLRASQKLLLADLPAEAAGTCTRKELLDFARQLGRRYLACNYSWLEEGLELRLSAARFNGATRMGDILPFFRLARSRVLLRYDGGVAAFCGPADAEFLKKMSGSEALNIATLEEQVASAVAVAWQNYRSGNLPAVERSLGQVSETEVFVKPPAQSPAKWLGVAVMIVPGVFALFLAVLLPFWGWSRWDLLHSLQQQLEGVQAEANDTARLINEANLRIEEWQAQARQLERQAAAEEPAAAERLHTRAEELHKQAGDESAAMEKQKQKLVRLTDDMRELQREFTRAVNPPAEGNDAQQSSR